MKDKYPYCDRGRGFYAVVNTFFIKNKMDDKLQLEVDNTSRYAPLAIFTRKDSAMKFKKIGKNLRVKKVIIG